MESKISLIAGIGKNRELGRGNDLIWRTKEDMEYFKNKTVGHPVIMGRKTYESIPPKFRPLPKRENIVITRNPDWKPDGGGTVVTFAHIEDALSYAGMKDEEEVFVIGGAQIYEAALPYAHRLYLTLIDDEASDADTFFPEYKEFNTVLSRQEKTTESGLHITWMVLEK